MVKVLVFVAIIALARAAVLPVPYPGVLPNDFEYETPAQYSFDYKVEDPVTGDFKTQYETRDGDVVKGKYSFVEADGSERMVEYFADAIHGFNAIVTNSVTGTVSHGISPGVISGPGPVEAKLAVPVPAEKVVPVTAPIARVASPYPYGNYGYPHAGNYPGQFGSYSPYNTGYYPRFY